MTRFALSALAALVALASPSWAQNEPRPAGRGFTPPAYPCAAMAVLSNGRQAERVPFKKQTWIEGRPGSEYSISIRNNCPFRVLAVVSVDGLNILTGSEASYASNGYVLDPGQTADLSGWRKSNDQVAAFYFSSPSNSYAARVGKGANLGVIGAAFFQEKRAEPAPPIFQFPSRSMESSGIGAAQDSMARSQGEMSAKIAPAPTLSAPSLGTGHGRRIDSQVRSTTFDRQNQPFMVDSLRYESRERLLAMGAITRYPSGPNPFPTEPSYVPDPPSYRR